MKKSIDFTILLVGIVLLIIVSSSSCSPGYGKGCMAPGELAGPGSWKTKFTK